MTRAQIEQRSRCVWFDRLCPVCGKVMYAFEAPAPLSYDYVLLCQTPACENWRKVAMMDDQMSDFTEADFEALDFPTVSNPPTIYGIPEEINGHPVADWLQETQTGTTKLDYREWVEQRVEDNPDDYCRTCFEPYAGDGDGWDGECPTCADRTYAMGGADE